MCIAGRYGVFKFHNGVQRYKGWLFALQLWFDVLPGRRDKIRHSLTWSDASSLETACSSRLFSQQASQITKQMLAAKRRRKKWLSFG